MSLYLELFWVFFKIDLISFGGISAVLPLLERMLVKEHGWITHHQFIQAYTLCQFIPGPNMALAPLIGFWVAGTGGFLAAFAGMYSGPVLLFWLVAALYRRSRNPVLLRRIEISLRPLVLGLVAATIVQYWASQSQGLVPRLWESRLLCLGLTIGGLLLYVRRITGPILLMSLMALAWWLLQISLSTSAPRLF